MSEVERDFPHFEAPTFNLAHVRLRLDGWERMQGANDHGLTSGCDSRRAEARSSDIQKQVAGKITLRARRREGNNGLARHVGAGGDGQGGGDVGTG